MTDEFVLPVILVIAGLGAAALVTISVMALYRRQTLSYFLVTLSIGMLLLRSLLGSVMLGGLMSHYTHHLLEHLLDVIVIGLLFTAVFTARRIDPERPSDVRYQDYND